MNKLLLLGAALALTSLTPPAYRTYRRRYGYRIDYPAAFLSPSPKNGAGRCFLSLSGPNYFLWQWSQGIT